MILAFHEPFTEKKQEGLIGMVTSALCQKLTLHTYGKRGTAYGNPLLKIKISFDRTGAGFQMDRKLPEYLPSPVSQFQGDHSRIFSHVAGL